MKDDNNQNGVRPDYIEVNLLANGQVIDTQMVSEKSDWQYVFDQLPVYQNGREIRYHVQEKMVQDYSARIEGNDIQNSYTPGRTNINVIKIWDDKDNQREIRPTQVIMRLYANDRKTGQEIILSEKNNWQGDFKELPASENNQLIMYSIKEERVAGYETKIVGNSEQGFVVTNSYSKKLPREG